MCLFVFEWSRSVENGVSDAGTVQLVSWYTEVLDALSVAPRAV